MTHPNEALFDSGNSLPIIPTCEHFAGSEKFILKAMSLQEKMGPIFDITCDCEDGAETGKELEHAKMIVRLVNSEANKFDMAGCRIHDHASQYWKDDVDILVPGAGEKLAYITLPKSHSMKILKHKLNIFKLNVKKLELKEKFLFMF